MWFVSTVYRQSSAAIDNPPGYYETIVWEWNSKTKKRGKMIICEGVGYTPKVSMKKH